MYFFGPAMSPECNKSLSAHSMLGAGMRLTNSLELQIISRFMPGNFLTVSAARFAVSLYIGKQLGLLFCKQYILVVRVEVYYTALQQLSVLFFVLCPMRWRAASGSARHLHLHSLMSSFNELDSCIC